MLGTKDYQRLDKLVEMMMAGKASELPPGLFDHIQRYEVVDDLIRKYVAKKQVIAMMRVRFPELTATSSLYRLYDETVYVFNSRNTLHKNYWRSFLMEICQDALAKAVRSDNFKAIDMLVNRIIQLQQLDKADDHLPAKLEPHELMLVFKISNEQIFQLPVTEAKQLTPERKEELLQVLEESHADIELAEIIEEYERTGH